MSSNSSPATLTPISTLTPPSKDRIWLTSPHPRLPIVATCGADKSIRIYSLINFTLLSTITGGHKRSVRSCAWKPHVKGESVLATASFDATVGIWRRWDGHGGRDEEGLVGGLAAAERGGDDDGEDNEEEEEDEEEWGFAVLLDGHDSEVKSVSWSPGGSLLATCSRDKSIWIWEDLEDGDNNFETVAVLQEHSGDVKCVSWHPEEECFASGSYDDTIRIWREDIDDWGQVACLRGHEGTVWFLDWESGIPSGEDAHPAPLPLDPENGAITAAQREQWINHRAASGPRIVSCSDDKTVRIWRKQPRQQVSSGQPSSMPSIIRPMGIDETWVEESTLPARHDLSIYSVAWSKKTGLVASVGADGQLVVYQERFIASPSSPGNDLSKTNGQNTDTDTDTTMTTPPPPSNPAPPEPIEVEQNGNEDKTEPSPPSTKWEIITSTDAAHGIYEINHVCWARRADRQKGEDGEEEVLLTTGDDGVVRVWKVENVPGA